MVNFLTSPPDLSSSHPDTHYRNLDWSQSMNADHSHLETLIHEIIDPDVILGADIVRWIHHSIHEPLMSTYIQVFDPQLIPSLVGTLKIALLPSKSSKKARVSIMALTMRNEDTLNQFLAQLRGMSYLLKPSPWRTEFWCRIMPSCRRIGQRIQGTVLLWDDWNLQLRSTC